MLRWFNVGLIGLAGGLASGLFGVGGGVLFVPLLVLLLGFNIHLAIGTSLVAIIPTALVGAFRHFAANSLDLKIALVLSLFAMVGAWLGSGLSLQMDMTALRKLFAVFLFIMALRLFFKQ